MTPRILMRVTLAEQDEYTTAQQHFDVIQHRTDCQPGDLIIPRYSALPYIRELDHDVRALGAQLINPPSAHNYVADITNWYPDLEAFTPRTWFRPEDVPRDQPGAFVLKGTTNSRKHQWRTHMFAPDRGYVGHVLNNLLDDPFVAQQGIVVRQFETFTSIGTAIGGLPITHEFRFFVLDREVVASGFYWSDSVGDLERVPSPDSVPRAFLDEVIAIVAPNIRFFVVDVALRNDGVWRVVELNDGQMSGLSCCDAAVLYANMARVLKV